MTALGLEPFVLKVPEIKYESMLFKNCAIHFPSFPESTNGNTVHSQHVDTCSPKIYFV